MSTYVMAACWPIQCPPTPKAVLISLADNANDHGSCWPSIATICERTCFSKRAVIDAIQWLEEHGLLEADRTNGRHTRYQIITNGRTPDLFESQKTSASRAPVQQKHQFTSRTGAPDAPVQQPQEAVHLPHQPVRQMHTNRQEPTRTKSEERAPAGARLPPDWSPSDEETEFAKRERPGVDVAAEAEKFRDYWHSLAGAKARRADWPATWRNWIRRIDVPKGADGRPAAAGQDPSAQRDWRESSETPLQREIAHIRQMHGYGEYGEGLEADAERDRLIAEARQRLASAAEAEGQPA